MPKNKTSVLVRISTKEPQTLINLFKLKDTLNIGTISNTLSYIVNDYNILKNNNNSLIHQNELLKHKINLLTKK